MPDDAALCNVPSLRSVDAVEMADSFSMFGILPVGNVDLVVEDYRSADQLISGFWPHRILRIAIELPQLLTAHCIIATHPAIALSVHNLNNITNLAYGW